MRGGGAKPWRQKGTGRARQGSIRSPQWTGGGIVFGPTPRSYGGKVNRKVRAQAFRAALRAQAERGTAALMDPTGWDAPSTKRAAEYLRQASDAIGGRPLLIVLEDADSVEARSFRNLRGRPRAGGRGARDRGRRRRPGDPGRARGLGAALPAGPPRSRR